MLRPFPNRHCGTLGTKFTVPRIIPNLKNISHRPRFNIPNKYLGSYQPLCYRGAVEWWSSPNPFLMKVSGQGACESGPCSGRMAPEKGCALV